ncbi:guanylate kinase [Aneurinibacillus aneurinilyticus]|jgi:guanylate kinase|uniref:Guanylate kinase n=2 Tax=Aneurinibacillus aneurinilyticus TaxID=1391 RepID=A0A848CS65_ANEAE|nr:guanylate kinase [Aneurinibacillus aneurinilyticus]ERI11589.1 guanylate kinase [Aneurinibacillus aneurinilyticus ATCC 12856]MCI1694865.1 guanylate kinase [Aneurinibacillus aneurinilyticus]MED0672907.1 guanylate kinase [Aneurinibacillus aneurinilyticus]MED0708961.1 guanylate kinase [Aneurinibacillus aneurinilyticus]MED0723764.1 guanylate kinase [Aneurinibacillus aneurinilyticus]
MFNLKEKEFIFVFTGPDGAGRKTIAEMIFRSLDIPHVVSYTTRPKKPMEVEGHDYHFITEEQFHHAAKNSEFLEVVVLDGYHYGIKEVDITSLFKEHQSVIMVLNAEGTETIKRLYGDKVVRFFIYADSETVIERQKQRGDSEEDIKRHIAHYEESMEYREACEHVFENFDSSHTAFEITKLFEKYLNVQFLEE